MNINKRHFLLEKEEGAKWEGTSINGKFFPLEALLNEKNIVIKVRNLNKYVDERLSIPYLRKSCITLKV